ncbi:MAG: hypothetical protein V7742_21255 [Halioglobus sp.]
MTAFTTEEISVLKQVYDHVPARRIRAETGIDPWSLVARHRALPQDEYEAVQRRIRGPRNPLGNQTWITEASPDSRHYKRGFVIAGQRRPPDAGLEQLGLEIRFGLRAQAAGHDATQAVEAIRAGALVCYACGLVGGCDCDHRDGSN